MRLFKEDNFQVVINPEAKLIPEFKKIITNDKDRKKETHTNTSHTFTSCATMISYSIYPEGERKQRLLKDLHIDDKCPITQFVRNGMDKYNELQRTPAITNYIKQSKKGCLHLQKL